MTKTSLNAALCSPTSYEAVKAGGGGTRGSINNGCVAMKEVTWGSTPSGSTVHRTACVCTGLSERERQRKLTASDATCGTSHDKARAQESTSSLRMSLDKCSLPGMTRLTEGAGEAVKGRGGGGACVCVRRRRVSCSAQLQPPHTVSTPSPATPLVFSSRMHPCGSPRDVKRTA